MLFNVWIICFTLIVGGAVLLWIDQLDLRPRYIDAEKYSLPMYFYIGLAQCVSMIPGVSRAGATIVAALLLGADRRSAAEFSFWLAMPTMAGAFAYDLFKNRDVLSTADLPIIATGFVAAFVVAVIVVRYLLDYVSRHGYALFGGLQVQAANEAGLNPTLLAAANSSGGVLGKMISPQNLAIGAAAVGLAGQEGELFRTVLKWSIALVLIMCVLVLLQSTPILSWMVV